MLAISKPVTYTSDNWAGAVATYDVGSLNNAQDINGYITSDNSTLGHNIGWETSPNNTDWSNGSTAGYAVFTIVVSAIGSDTSPSIAALNSHPLITDYLHSSHSNSLNGSAYNLAGTAVTWDYSSMTISISGADTISYTGINVKYVTGTLTASDGVRTVDTSGSTWYLNGIQTGSQSQSSSTSGNEYYTDDTFGSTFQYSIPKTFTSGDYATKVQGAFGGSAFVNQGRSIDISAITNTDSEKITALLKAIDIKTFRQFKKEL